MAVPSFLLHRRGILRGRLLSDESRCRLLAEHLEAVEGTPGQIPERSDLSSIVDDLEAEVRHTIDLAALDGLSASERLEQVQIAPVNTFADPRLARVLLSRSRAALSRDRKIAAHWARLAEEVARRGGHRTLRAVSLAHQANLSRLDREMASAQTLMESARALARSVPSALADLAEIDSLEASFARDLDDATRAVAHFRQSVARARLADESVQAAISLIGLGLAYQDLGLYPAAVAATREALPLLDPQDHEAARLSALARINLALQWGLAGEPAYARRAFTQAKERLSDQQKVKLAAHLEWIEGFLCAVAGEWDDAVALLRSTFDHFRDAHDWHHALAVALDLVILFKRSCDEEGLVEIGEEILTHLQSNPSEHDKGRAILDLLARVVRREETPALNDLVRLRIAAGRLTGS